jgi:hypothetical protein
VHPPPQPARATFTLMTECTPESNGCYSLYSVISPPILHKIPARFENNVQLHGSRLQLYKMCIVEVRFTFIFPRTQFQNVNIKPGTRFTRFTARGCSFLTKFSFIKTIKYVKEQRETLLY